MVGVDYLIIDQYLRGTSVALVEVLVRREFSRGVPLDDNREPIIRLPDNCGWPGRGFENA